MPARFILSFDCEGKWGSADELSSVHHRTLTDEKLGEAYRSILGLLDEYQVEATFAFAGLFSQSSAQLDGLMPEIRLLAERSPDYLGLALRDIDASNGEGWHGAHLVDAVLASGLSHEVALHGVTHVPWTRMDDAFVDRELGLFKRLDGPVRHSRTFVYPRNLVAHSEKLDQSGFVGFRAARPKRSRLVSLLSEFNLLEKPEEPDSGSGIVAIPAGFFLNWRSGLRKLVPPSVTRARARNLVQHASRTGRVVHYWLHPENLASAPSTFELLKGLIVEVANARDAGKCEILTQLAYCQSLKS